MRLAEKVAAAHGLRQRHADLFLLLVRQRTGRMVASVNLGRLAFEFNMTRRGLMTMLGQLSRVGFIDLVRTDSYAPYADILLFPEAVERYCR